MQQSILGQILPEAMVCYLENYGAEKFAEIFLGEFDTPEVSLSFTLNIFLQQPGTQRCLGGLIVIQRYVLYVGFQNFF